MSDQCICPDIPNITILGVIIANIIISLGKPIIYKIMHTKLLNNLIKHVDEPPNKFADVKIESSISEKKEENKI